MTLSPAADPPGATTPHALPPRIRQRAAAIVVRQDGKVLLHRLESDTFWALPGGAIEPGETACEAITREMHEELNTTVALGSLGWVVENFFHHAGESIHEIGLYLDASPLPGSLLAVSPGPYEGAEGGHKLVFAWFAGDELACLDLRPTFLREVLAHEYAGQRGATPARAGARHIVHRDTLQPAPALIEASVQAGPGSHPTHP